MSLRSRIAFVLTLVTIIICLLFSSALIAVGYQVEDRILEQGLQASMLAFKDEHARNPQAKPPEERMIHGWAQLADAPEHFQPVFAQLKPGMYEWQREQTLVGYRSVDQRDRYLGVIELNNGENAYFSYETWKVEDENFEERQVTPLVSVSAAGILMTLVAAWLLVDRWIVRRLQSLSSRLAQPGTAVAVTDLIQRDEVGTLAKEIQAYQERITGFLDREKRLTRDVSHELRTPITVLQGALDLLDQRTVANPEMHKPLARMRRATETMAMLVDAFLVTARENQAPDQACDIVALVHDRIESFRPLLEVEDKEIQVQATTSVELEVWPAPVAIIVDNLLRNAIEHSSEPVINVTIHDGCLTVTNAIDSVVDNTVLTDGQRGPTSQGHGYGLSIAKEFAHRLGWRFDLDLDNPNQFCCRCTWEIPTEETAA